MRTTVLAFVFAMAFFLTRESAFCDKLEMKKVTRIETVTVVKKGNKLVVTADGMAPTTMRLLTNNGELVRRSPEHQPNKDGLLEYDLLFAPPKKTIKPNRLESVRGTLTETSFPDSVKGALVYSEFNQLKGMIAPPKSKKKQKPGEGGSTTLSTPPPAATPTASPTPAAPL
jgi:hypothetical protein